MRLTGGVGGAVAKRDAEGILIRDRDDLGAVLGPHGGLAQEELDTLDDERDQRGVAPAELAARRRGGRGVAAIPPGFQQFGV